MNSQGASPDTHKETVYGSWAEQPGLEVTSRPLHAAPAPLAPPERLICGVRRPTFFLSLALVVVIIAAAVGGGVGGSLAVQNAKSSACASNTTTTTEITVVMTTETQPAAATGPTTPMTTTTGPIVVPTGVVKLDCPGLSDDVVISLGPKSWIFTPTCGVDYNGSDFAAVIVYSFHDCLQACAAHNYFSGQDECAFITFRANQTNEIPANFGNCWLKQGSPQGNQIVDASADLVAGAKLKATAGQSSDNK